MTDTTPWVSAYTDSPLAILSPPAESPIDDPTMNIVTLDPEMSRLANPRHAARQHRHPMLRAITVVAVGLVAFAVTGTALAYNALQGNITTHDLSSLLGEDRPGGEEAVDPRVGQPLNVLVMGSDVRTGENAALGGAPDTEGMRSDTTLLVHVSADRTRADIVSIPRDLLVDVPECQLPDGSTTRPQRDVMFNSAFALGGQDDRVDYAAACTIRTVEQMTGVFIDDFVVVDFAGFAKMVDALGGVPMCIEEPMRDRLAGLDLDAGEQVLDGHEALAYARARKSVGDGSDISRIGRQQVLFGAMVRQVLSKNLLTDMPALYSFLDAATESVTAGPTIGRLPSMVGLANSVRAVPAGGVTFVTVPFDWAGNRVAPNAHSAALWAAIAADEPIAPDEEPPTDDGVTTPVGESASDDSASPTTAATPGVPEPTTTPTARPWDVITGADDGDLCA